MKNIYPFTNENLSSYQNLYNFDNATVLSVLGSGDQYFSSLLYGAKEIELYDCNFSTWDFFLLKYYGILTLNYEAFYDFFVRKQLDDLNQFYKLLTYLPQDTAKRLTNLQKKYQKLSHVLYLDMIDDKYHSGRVIPYFDEQEYYRLQTILRNEKIPKFYLSHLQSLPYMLENNCYDIILTSNIFDWLYSELAENSIEEYKTLLNKFNYQEIQALYCWSLSESLQEKFENHNFEIQTVPSIKSLSLSKDSVISLRKK